MKQSMTSRERWTAALQCQPLDRLPFWPKLFPGYAPNQPEPFRSMDMTALHQYMGSDIHHWGPAGVKAVRQKTSVETTWEDPLRRTVYTTPYGTLTYVERFDRPSWSLHPVEFPVKSRENIAILTEVHEDTNWALDPDEHAKAQALQQQVGEDGIIAATLGTSPLMDWIQHIAGIENGHYFLADYREDVEALFDAMHRSLLRRAEVLLAYTPFPIVYSIENTSTTLISPDMFRQYCYPHLADCGRVITAADKLHILHMCGKLKKLLPDIGTLPASAIEAFTSPPVGNTTLLDGRTDAPKLCFIGGTNATDWLEPADVIIQTIERDLCALPHQRGVVVTSAGVMPPRCAPETIKRVADWVKTFPVSA